MKISIITVAYKSPDVLQKSIDSFFKFNDLGDEVEYILVDNSPSKERVCEKLTKETLEKIIYIPADNKGFGSGNNRGALVAKGEILAFINPDIIFIEPVLSKIYKRFCENKTCAMMGCKLLYDDLTPGFSFYYDYKHSIFKKWYLKYLNRINAFNQKQMYISGANIFVRKELFFLSGMFDESIFMYYEEPDLTRRILSIDNFDIMFNPDLKLIHLEKKSTPNSLNSIKSEFESCIYYGKKYNLDYARKINFEYRYLLLKKSIYKIFNKDKYESTKQACEYLQDTYFKKRSIG